MKIYQDSQGRRVEARDVDGRIEYCAEGGGRIRCTDADTFAAEFKPAAPRSSVLLRGRYTLDSEPDDVWHVGYSDGRAWNGWATPRFTREVLVEICRVLGASIRWEGDTAHVTADDDADPEVCSPHTYDTVDGQIALYAIGDCWHPHDVMPFRR